MLCSISLLLRTQIPQVIFDREVTAIQGIDFSVLPDNNKAFGFLLLQHGTGHACFNLSYLVPMDIVELPDTVDEVPVALIQILQHIFNLRYVDVIAVQNALLVRFSAPVERNHNRLFLGNLRRAKIIEAFVTHICQFLGRVSIKQSF